MWSTMRLTLALQSYYAVSLRGPLHGEPPFRFSSAGSRHPCWLQRSRVDRGFMSQSCHFCTAQHANAGVPHLIKILYRCSSQGFDLPKGTAELSCGPRPSYLTPSNQCTVSTFVGRHRMSHYAFMRSFHSRSCRYQRFICTKLTTGSRFTSGPRHRHPGHYLWQYLGHDCSVR